VKYSIELTKSAEDDLADLANWIAHNDSIESAEYVLDQIEVKSNSLRQQPKRGLTPPELRSLGIDRFRELFFKPYRIIYQVRGSRVVVNLIADGRRDMSSLLQRRLTSAR
jgi:toxin ParE1/3/4